MIKTALQNFLKEIELFSDFTNDEILILIEHLEERKFSAGEIIFNEDVSRQEIFLIYEGEIELFKTSPFGDERRLSYFKKYDFLGEGALMDDAPHSTSARALSECTTYFISTTTLKNIQEENSSILIKMLIRTAKVISRRMSNANARLVNVGTQYISGRTRMEHDLLGDRSINDEFLFGIQTLRAIENFNISGVTLSFYPLLIESLAMVKKAAVYANKDLGLIENPIVSAIIRACDMIIQGNYHKQFVVDMIQGGAGTSTNMNANEVIANVALPSKLWVKNVANTNTVIQTIM